MMFLHDSWCRQLQLDVSSSVTPCIGASRTLKVPKTSSKYCTMVQYLVPLRYTGRCMSRMHVSDQNPSTWSHGRVHVTHACFRPNSLSRVTREGACHACMFQTKIPQQGHTGGCMSRIVCISVPMLLEWHRCYFEDPGGSSCSFSASQHCSGVEIWVSCI
jgi:hypothetical protein